MDYPRVGVGARFVALAIDVLFVLAGIPAGVLAGAALGMLSVLLEQFRVLDQSRVFPLGAVQTGAMGGIYLGFYLGIPLFALGIAVNEARGGNTPGKRALGLRIGTTGMTRAPRSRLAIRAAAKHLLPLAIGAAVLFGGTLIGLREDVLLWCLLAVCLLWIAGCLLALGGRRQALHDRMAATAVWDKEALQSEG